MLVFTESNKMQVPQVLEALALGELPQEVEDTLQPDIQGMQKVGRQEVEAFKVSHPCWKAFTHIISHRPRAFISHSVHR